MQKNNASQNERNDFHAQNDNTPKLIAYQIVDAK
jgi:hypothetical protein